jgi:non-ribosomal peptide synthetase component F
VPIGVTGELYIGGDGLSRGYQQRPALTAEKFVPDPFSTQPGRRLYRTGDLARFAPDGSIQYLGRVDFQVKVRGFRIELGEIETALSQQPAVREVVLLTHEDEANHKRLIAYLVGEPIPDETLRHTLKQTLPDYMIPARFLWLDKMPLLPNGKVNRHALPAPDTSRPDLATTFTPPRTEVEAILTQIWTQALHLDNVGIHDNFFELGGDSILYIQVFVQLQ